MSKKMARWVHYRWCLQKIKLGWIYGNTRNNKRKKHNDLLFWIISDQNNLEDIAKILIWSQDEIKKRFKHVGFKRTT